MPSWLVVSTAAETGEGRTGEAYVSSPASAQKSLPLVHGSGLSHGTYLSPREPGNQSLLCPRKKKPCSITFSPPGASIPFPLCLSHTLFHSPEMPCPLHSEMPTRDRRPESRLQRDGTQHTGLIPCLCAFASATHSFNKHLLSVENTLTVLRKL